MSKQAIRAEEKRTGLRLLALRRQYNRMLHGGAKQVTVAVPGRAPKPFTITCGSEEGSTATLACLKEQTETAADASLWTQNNILIHDEPPALGPWMTVDNVLSKSKPYIHVAQS